MNTFKKSMSFLTVLTLIFLSGSQLIAQDVQIPVIENGRAQVIPELENPENWIREDLWVETEFDSDRDGKPDRMHVDVTRPKQTEDGLKLPVVYETSPYYAGTAGMVDGLFWNVRHELGELGSNEVGEGKSRRAHPEVIRRGERPIISNSQIKTWVPRGYIVVHSSSPGTGLSDGAPTVGGDNESLAPKAVIEWLAGKNNGYTTRDGNEKIMATWSNGKVGMTGTSYNGTLPLAAATTGVDGLEVIIPVAPNTSYYHYYRSNGLVRSPGGYLGEDIDVLYDFIHSGEESMRERNNLRIRDTEMAENMDRRTGDYNEFWAGRDYLNDMPGMKAAMLMSHGFNDWNVMPEHSYRIYAEAKKMGLHTQIYYHQFGHGGPPPVEMMNRWFTHYLFGVDNGIRNETGAWIVREYDDPANPAFYPDFPNPAAEPVTLYLNSGAPQKGSLSLNKPGKQGTETLVDNFSFDGESLARAEITDHRLLYVTPPLQDSLHISGLPTINIKLASSKPAANLSVWLVSLPWDERRNGRITDNIITRGWADPQNHESLTESEPLKPGKFYELIFELQPDDQIIRPGQQIGLMIFSSDKEYTIHPDPGTELTVDLDATTFTLPVVGGKAAIDW
ncbi:Xaa-Pro dipeptidyl-peptidase [Gracilimonas sp. BCB1]|uniref:Xaa-Pro dipeptidyl-peptidase n=1 Tax=Gracilimonas sp. BCB1 TaxID=3152362 RepID=UPI0032D8B6B7